MISLMVIWLITLGVIIIGVVSTFISGYIFRIADKVEYGEKIHKATKILSFVFDIVFLVGLAVLAVWYYLF